MRSTHLSRAVAGLLSATISIFSMAVFHGCGEPSLGVTTKTYKPRIVVEAVLMPGYPVRGVRITRNARVDEPLFYLTLTDATVVLIDDQSGERFNLTFHDSIPDHHDAYRYEGDGLTVEHGNSYSLEVIAEVDGQTLTATATTIVPEAGFEILGLNYDRLGYRQMGEDGEAIDLKLRFQRSPGVPLYLMTVVPNPAEATPENFIYDNPFTDESPRGLDLDDFNFEWEWMQNPPLTAGVSIMDVLWWDLWFYTDYKIIVYAADVNYARFIQTFDEVQEEDGNFHEPVFSIDGDGIGFFGSAIPDTVRLEITR